MVLVGIAWTIAEVGIMLDECPCLGWTLAWVDLELDDSQG